MALESFAPIFSDLKAEWDTVSNMNVVPLRRFLILVFALDYYHLKIQVTDFHSYTFEAVKSVSQLEEMWDISGIGDTWSGFLDYFISSINSENLKLVLQKHQLSNEAGYAKLVGQKSKGMPLISMSLAKVQGCNASDAMENICWQLYSAFKCRNGFMKYKDSCILQCNPRVLNSRVKSDSHILKGNKIEMNGDGVQGYIKETGKQSSGSSSLKDSSETTDHIRAPMAPPSRSLPSIRRPKVRGVHIQNDECEDN